MTAILRMQGVAKSFGGLRALRDVNLEVEEGGIAGLVGPNGAGKTTCFNLIAGVYRPDQGTICLDGERIDGLRPDQVCRAGIGRTFQIVKPFAGLSVLDNVIVGALARNSDVHEARECARAMIDLLGLGPKWSEPASTLTLPDRKRLEVARALATNPRVLLLDEVMAGLRPTEVDMVVSMLRGLRDRTGLTILLIEHVMRAVMTLCERVMVLHHGVLISQGTPREVTADPAVIESYLGKEVA